MSGEPNLRELVDVDIDRLSDDEGLDHLQRLLRAAVRIEWATIAPYLTAMWSIDDQHHPTALSIRRIVQQEMLHASLACNLLTAVGGAPAFASPDWQVAYPARGLPLEVLPDLSIELVGFGDDALRTFVQIEQPDHVVEIDPNGHLTFTDEPAPTKTIGEAYDQIRRLFHGLAPELDVGRQLTGPLARMVVTDLDDVDHAIGLILHQGEGSSRSPMDSGPDDLSHYYRFLELQHKRQIVEVDGIWQLGPALEDPDSRPVASTSTREPDPDGEAGDLMRRFDRSFTTVLRDLQAAWAGGSQAHLISAIQHMFELEGPARALMMIERPDGEGTYGPRFALCND